MIEAAPSVNFFISILDNGYSVRYLIVSIPDLCTLTYFNYNQRSNQCKLECYNCQKKKKFNKFHLILIYLFVPKIKKMKKIVTKYVVCYINN